MQVRTRRIGLRRISNTITHTSSPIRSVSPIRRVKLNMHALHDRLDPGEIMLRRCDKSKIVNGTSSIALPPSSRTMSRSPSTAGSEMTMSTLQNRRREFMQTPSHLRICQVGYDHDRRELPAAGARYCCGAVKRHVRRKPSVSQLHCQSAGRNRVGSNKRMGDFI